MQPSNKPKQLLLRHVLTSFRSHLAQANKYYIAWENVAPQNMLEAAIESFTGDAFKLTALIRENLRALDRDG